MAVDKQVGDQMFREASRDMTATFRNFAASSVVCFLTYYLEVLFGLGDIDLEWIKSMVTRKLEICPDGAFDLMFAARYYQITGDNSKAIEHFERSIVVQSEFVQQHNAARWDLLWCHAMNCDWSKAADIAANLRDNCKWSPATNAYQYACFLLMMVDTESRSDLLPEVQRAMASVHELRTRYGGKTLPPEKFAITMAQRYCDSNDDSRPQLPALMLFYIWNVFANCADNPELMTPFINIVTSRLANINSTSDQFYVLMLIKGVCLRNSREPEKALFAFETIMESEDSIEIDTYVAPHAAMERGLTLIDLGRHDEAKYWLERARDKYSKFLIETIVHLRIHGALQKLDRLMKSDNN